jgi:uncharacterized protein (TIGR02145 family)
MKTKMVKAVYVTLLVMFFVGSMFAQVGINSDGSDPDGSAMLDVKSNTKGFLPPRMTYAQRNAITGAPAGLIIWCSDCSVSGELEVYNGTVWTNMVGDFACGGPLVDSRDGKSYTTVLIGTQCWMAQNLNIGTKLSGSVSQTDNSTIEKYCYGDIETNCDVYGGLYQWNEMMKYVTTEGTKGICPTGWHLPTDAEFSTLINYLGGVSVAGGKMKEVGTTHWLSPNTGATNISGFTGLPGGFRNSLGGGIFFNLATVALFWSSSQDYSPTAWHWDLWYNNETVSRYSNDKATSFSARCVRD